MKIPLGYKLNLIFLYLKEKIDADALNNWLNVLEGYFFVHNFINREKITFALLKEVPHVQNWLGTYWEKKSSDESRLFETNPT